MIDLSNQIAGGLIGVVKWSVRIENELVAVERVKAYIDEDEEINPETILAPDQSWPTGGKVVFNNYTARYRQDTGIVLENINVHIYAGEKVAIIGRTGELPYLICINFKIQVPVNLPSACHYFGCFLLIMAV